MLSQRRSPRSKYSASVEQNNGALAGGGSKRKAPSTGNQKKGEPTIGIFGLPGKGTLMMPSLRVLLQLLITGKIMLV